MYVSSADKSSPFFRIFNPQTQAKTYDPAGDYERTWIAEGQAKPPATALSWFDAVPRSWNLSPVDRYPAPVLDLALARNVALEAFKDQRPGRGLSEQAPG